MIWSKKPRVVIDTNVFVSGLLFGRKPCRVLECVAQQTVELLLSPTVEIEILRKVKQFDVPPEFVLDLAKVLEAVTRIVPGQSVRRSRDPKDDAFLELCVAGGADYLITGDKDLLTIKEIQSTKIVTVSEFLSIRSSDH